MNKHPSALLSGKELWKHLTPVFKLPPEMAHARICIRILWLSTSSPMIGRAPSYNFLLSLLRTSAPVTHSNGSTIIHPAWQIRLELLIWATPRPFGKPDYMSVTLYFGRKKSLRWNWKGTETEPGKALKLSLCWLQQGFISPRAWPAPLTGFSLHTLSCPKNPELNTLKARVYFRSSF